MGPTLQSVALTNRSVADLVAFGRAAIETAGTFDQVKDIRDQAEALKVYQRAQGAAQEAIDASVEIKLRAERRMGEELKAAQARGEVATPGGDKRSIKVRAADNGPTKLSDLGISRQEAARYQKLAATPEPLLDATIGAHKEQGIPLTTASVQRTTKAAADRNWSPADIRANPLPTAKEARKQALERGVSIPARDGKLHDGRSLEQERADSAAAQRAESVLHQLEAIVEIVDAGMTPRAYFDAVDLPRFGRVADDDLEVAWAKVWPWFREFNEIWSAHLAAE